MSKAIKTSLEFAIGKRLGSKTCKRHERACGKKVTEDGWHGLPCLKKQGDYLGFQT